MLKDLSAAQAEKKNLRAELEKYKECDPEVMESMKKEIVIARDAANRWTGKLWRSGVEVCVVCKVLIIYVIVSLHTKSTGKVNIFAVCGIK